MKMMRVLGMLGLAIAMALVAAPAQADYPDKGKTIRIVVPYTPGGFNDTLGRIVANKFSEAWGVQTVVENRPGGGTLIGTEAAAKAEPDGHTVLLVANSYVINPQLGRGNYDPVKSYEPICYLAGTPMVLVVQSSSPYKTVKDLVEAARATPGMAFASGGPGSSLHVAIEVLRLATGITIS
jgi:tripartite-type tricarboxylate transporter receptor subunit TctC